MDAVVMVFNTSLVAVPAFIRVEPVTTSGPVRVSLVVVSIKGNFVVSTGGWKTARLGS